MGQACTRVLAVLAGSKAEEEAPVLAPQVAAEKKVYSWDKRRAEKDPANFLYQNLRGQKILRESGKVAGEMIVIADCHDCQIVILDYSAAVTIDDCTNCEFVLGPVESSVFIRTSKDCTCSFVCRQFRSRDIERCRVKLFCATRPIIESSSRVEFGRYDFNYQSLGMHMRNTKLSPYKNFWSYIYDFTPGPQNFGYLAEGATTAALVDLPAGAAEGEALTHVTYGEREPAFNDSLLVLVTPEKLSGAGDVIQSLARATTVIHTNHAKLPADLQATLAAAADLGPDVLAALAAGPILGIECAVDGPDALARIQDVAFGLPVVRSHEAAKEFRYAGIEG